MMCSKVLEGELYLAISTVLFAIEIVASRKATNNIAGPSTFKAWTRILSTVILYILKRPLQSALDSNIGDNKEPEHIEVLARVKKQLPFINEYTFDLYFWGAISGLSNVGVSLCFQTGLLTVQAGKAAFINGLYVVATPFLASLIPGASYRITPTTWFCVGLCVIGTYFLSNPESSSSSFGIGEIFMLGSMLSCTISVIASDLGSKRVDCVDLTLVEFSISSVLCTIASLLMEAHMWYWPLPALQDGISLIALVAVIESFAYLVGTVGQTYSTSSRAALIYSLESVFALLLGYVLLNETLTRMELLGCMLLFIATYMSSAEGLYEASSSSETIEEAEVALTIDNAYPFHHTQLMTTNIEMRTTHALYSSIHS